MGGGRGREGLMAQSWDGRPEPALDSRGEGRGSGGEFVLKLHT